MTNRTIPQRDPGDIGRRIAHRRTELGLTTDEVAARAGMDPGYIEYLESQPAQPGYAALVRLAVALETTSRVLAGGGVDLPAGQGERGRPATDLYQLTLEECSALLAPGGVGRFVFYDARGPVAIPVNFRMMGTDVIFRTAVGTSVRGGIDRGRVSFEVDHIDDAMQQGWSVLVSGYAREVRDPQEVAQLADLGLAPWPSDERPILVRIAPVAVSGRRISIRSTTS